ncbi:MAG: hypothetical protein H7232_04850 [Aeromicrobium sp.]|nr:hypothetical protein [Burkholderiales bacterium]
MTLIEIINHFDGALQQLESGGAFTADKSYPQIAVTPTKLQVYFASLLEELRSAADSGIEINPIDAVVYSNPINGALNNFSQFVPQVLSNPGNIIPLVDAFVALRSALSSARVLDQPAPGAAIQKAVADLQARAIASAKRIERDREKSAGLLHDATGHEAALKDGVAKGVALTAEVVASHTKSVESVASIERVLAQVQDLSVQRAALVKTTEELEKLLGEKSERSDELLKAAQGLREETEKRLMAATKVGLASAFSAREVSSRRSFWAWSVALVVVLSLLFWAAYSLIQGLPPDLDAWSTAAYWLTHAPMTVPCIWFAWFASKQASYALRLSEDYAFKAASALSLTAYKNEASAVDPEMVKKLMDVAVTNFGENPLRIFDSKTVSGSPLSDLLKDKDVVSALKDAAKALPDFMKKLKG